MNIYVEKLEMRPLIMSDLTLELRTLLSSKMGGNGDMDRLICLAIPWQHTFILALTDTELLYGFKKQQLVAIEYCLEPRNRRKGFNLYPVEVKKGDNSDINIEKYIMAQIHEF